MPADFGVAFDGGEAPDTVRALAQEAETAGVRRLWFAAHLFTRDPLAMAALALAATRRINIALMAVSPYVTHPVAAAMAAATLEEAYPGRIALCFGVGAPRDLAAAGVAAPRPLATMRETFAIARALLRGETVAHEGERWQVSGRRLATRAASVPLLLAASGPRMLTLAGAIADGVVISAATCPAFVAWSLAQAGGTAPGFRRIGLVYAAMDADPGRAHARLRRSLAFVLRGAHHAHNLRLAGTELDQAALTEAHEREDWARLEGLVPNEVVQRHAASGTVADVQSALDAYRAVGLDEIVLSGIAQQPERATIIHAAINQR